MAMKIIEHALKYEDRVRAFNRRMKQKGSDWAFYEHPVPQWIPKKGDQSVWRQFYLVLDDQDEVRGGYCLKRQAFWFGGQVHRIASFQGPVSEGAVDRKYNLVAVRVMLDMLAREPLMFAYGSNPEVTKLLRAGKWWVTRIPLCLKVTRPYRFLRRNRMLRNSTSRKCILDALAFSGLGCIGLRGAASMSKIVHHCPSRAKYEIVETFDDWTDELWHRSRSSYDIVAVRDKEALNLLMPKEGWPPVTRLKIKLGNQVIGMAAVLDTQMQDDRRFGSLRVGTIVDSFGLLEHAGRVVAAAANFLEQSGVDLVIANQTHPQWLRGFRANGFHVLQRRRVLALSSALQRHWGATESVLHGLHMTNLDGDGPLGLAPAGPPLPATDPEPAGSKPRAEGVVSRNIRVATN